MNIPKVLIIGYVWPEPRSSAAGLRTLNLVHTFKKAGWEIHFASASLSNSYRDELDQQGVCTHAIQLNDSAFDSWIRKLNPEYVIFDRFVTEEQFGWRVQEQCPQAVRVLDTQDLHFLRRAREKALKNGASLDELSQLDIPLLSDPIREDTLRELGSIYRCDGTFIISSFELELLRDRFHIPSNLLSLSRFHYPTPPDSPSFSERKGFVMIGNFRHKPNSDGILWYRNEIWPEIRKRLPTAETFIYGAYPPREMMALSDPRHGFQVMGSAPDQFQVLRSHRVSMAPLRFGAGIKGKISDSWWSGTPVVTTTLGAEGMHDPLPWGGAISNCPIQQAELAVQLYTQEDLWTQSQQNGFEIIRKLYTDSLSAPLLLDFLIRLRENLAIVRESNWIGQMLALHQYRSTKYFSRWIETKERFVNKSLIG